MGNNKINYTEFLAATISVQTILTDEKLLAIFKQFDTDSSGFITRDNIVAAMNKLGQHINEKELDAIMQNHDIKGDNRLSFEEFKMIFMDIKEE